MTLDEQIQRYARQLPPELQEKLLGILQELVLEMQRPEATKEQIAWNHFSLESAMRDMLDEPELYQESDVKVHFHRGGAAHPQIDFGV